MFTLNYTKNFKKEANKLLLKSNLVKVKITLSLTVKYNALMKRYYN